MADHKLMPKHGEAFVLLLNDATDKGRHIMALQQQASLDLLAVIAAARSDGTRVAFPCRQCILDTALLFHDLSEAIKELASVERK